MKFENQVVCITGAGRGLGFGMAETFAAEGAHVVIAEIDAETGAAAAEKLNGTFHQLDVSDAAQVKEVVTQIATEQGQIDVWINNAGVAHKGPAVDLTPDDWDADIGVMLSGAFYCANQVGRVMIEQGGGSMINMASVNGLFALQGPRALLLGQGRTHYADQGTGLRMGRA